MKIFVTGGAGFIGSHTCVELLNAGFEITLFDNFSNSTISVIEQIEKITHKTLPYIQGDIREEFILEKALTGFDCVIHFAGLKSVSESIKKPLEYYDTNVHGTLCLLRVMKKLNIKKLIFSSSATVYGPPQHLPLDEEHPLKSTNPYGHTKLVVEETLRALFQSDPSWSIVILRYFNPVGAHESALIGEDPQSIPNNLMPYIAQTAVGQHAYVNVFGNDYNTHDGTGVRDYIHVVDLAKGHLKALNILESPHCSVINLGTGKGYSVLDVIQAFSRICGKKVPYVFAPRREGDVASCFADPKKAKMLLDWEAQYDLDKMCQDMWRFQVKNPKRYQ